MIRALKEQDLSVVMKIWADANKSAHDFVSEEYWMDHYSEVEEALPKAEVYVYEEDESHEVIGFIGLQDDYIAGIFVKEGKRSKGVGKQLLDYVKKKRTILRLSVYQKNVRAVSFYQREQFMIQSENMEDSTGEKELIMQWREKEMKPLITIRNEEETDYERVEKITREAFYNMYMPGCVEHYLVHIMREHEDFVPELDFVLERDGEVVGNIMYTKARLVDENKEEKEILTFGPISVLPGYQRMGYGKLLMEHSFERAKALGYDVIVIFGSPANYVSSGFKSCKKYHVCMENGKYPAAMMVKELVSGTLDGRKWFYYDSPVMAISEEEAARYDDSLEKMEKKHQPSQEEFYIMSQAFIE